MDDSAIIGESLNTVLRACAQQLPEADMLKFGALKTDFERMDFVLKLDFVHKIIAFEASFDGKSKEKCQSFKEEGNKYFGKKSYMAALDSYTQAVLQAPLAESGDSSEDLAIALANRSAALLHLQRYDSCLRDLALSLEHGYPEHMQYKLYDRMGKCMLLKQQPDDARQKFLKATELLNLAKLDEKALKTWNNTLNKQLNNCDTLQANPPKQNNTCLPVLEATTHPVYTRAHGSLDVRNSETKGRFVKTNKNLRVGTILLDELPLASVLFSEFYTRNCYHCLSSCRVPVPCYQCSNVVFCSQECRQQAWVGYHRLEYPFMSLIGPDWCAKIGHLAFRLAITMGYSTVKAYMMKARDQGNSSLSALQRGLTADGTYATDYHAVYHMEENMKQRLPEGIFDFAMFAVFLLKLLQRLGYFITDTQVTPETQHSEELVLVGAFLLRNLKVIQCNGYSITEIQHPTDFEKPRPLEVGVGLYPTAALFNHSCDPNADLNFYGNRLYIRATRTIRPGEEVLLDYNMVFYQDPCNRRRGTLQFRYCFDCTCPACKEEWPLFQDVQAEVPSFACADCGTELHMGGDLIDKTSLRCHKCNSLNNLQERVSLLQVQHDLFSASMDDAVNGKTQAALPGLEDYLQLMQKYILPPWRDLVSCQAAIKNCYRLQANVREF